MVSGLLYLLLFILITANVLFPYPLAIEIFRWLVVVVAVLWTVTYFVYMLRDRSWVSIVNSVVLWACSWLCFPMLFTHFYPYTFRQILARNSAISFVLEIVLVLFSIVLFVLACFSVYQTRWYWRDEAVTTYVLGSIMIIVLYFRNYGLTYAFFYCKTPPAVTDDTHLTNYFLDRRDLFEKKGTCISLMRRNT